MDPKAKKLVRKENCPQEQGKESWQKEGFNWDTFQGNAWRGRPVCATQLAEVQALEALQPYHCHWVKDMEENICRLFICEQ